ncbi:zinc finger, CCHC-type containing protein [Tanacetum coccineum]
MGTMWCLFDPTPSGWCKTDAHSMDFDQDSNWLERLPAGSITTWEDLTNRFLAQFLPAGRTYKLHNDILMLQQHQGESISEARTRFKDLLQKVPHHGLVSNFMASQDARITRFEANFKQHQSEITNKLDTLLKVFNDRMTRALLSDTVKNPKLNPNSTSSARSYPTRDPHSSFNYVNAIQTCLKSTTNIQKDQLQVNTLTVNEIETPKPKEPKESLKYEFADLHLNLPVLEVLAQIGARPPYFAKRDFWDNHLPGEWEIARDAEVNPFKDILVVRKMVEFLGAIPINLKRNMWESEEVIFDEEKPESS